MLGNKITVQKKFWIVKAHSEPSQTSKMELFVKIVNNFEPLKAHFKVWYNFWQLEVL